MNARSIDRTAFVAEGWKAPWALPLIDSSLLSAGACASNEVTVALVDRPSAGALDGLPARYSLRLFAGQASPVDVEVPVALVSRDLASEDSADARLAEAIAGAARIIVGCRGHLVRLASRMPLPASRVSLAVPPITLPPLGLMGQGRLDSGAYAQVDADRVLHVSRSARSSGWQLGVPCDRVGDPASFLAALPQAAVIALTESEELGEQALIDACLASGRVVVACADAIRMDGPKPSGLITLPEDAGETAWKDALGAVQPGILPAL